MLAEAPVARRILQPQPSTDSDSCVFIGKTVNFKGLADRVFADAAEPSQGENVLVESVFVDASEPSQGENVLAVEDAAEFSQGENVLVVHQYPASQLALPVDPVDDAVATQLEQHYANVNSVELPSFPGVYCI